jgi:hypothetical protein
MQYKLFAFFKTWLPQIPRSELDRLFQKQQRLSNDDNADNEDEPFSEEEALLLDITVEPFSYAGGKDEFLNALNINNTITVTEMSNQPILLEKLQNVESALRTFRELETRALMFREIATQRLDTFATGHFLFPFCFHFLNIAVYFLKLLCVLCQTIEDGDVDENDITLVDEEVIEREKEMRALSNSREGFIYWIRHSVMKKKELTNLPSIRFVKPNLIVCNGTRAFDEKRGEYIYINAKFFVKAASSY